jgi:cyclohexadieny/prephenate dehydrogenase
VPEPFDTVAIVGVGLLGGSIGLAVRERHLARRVIGVGRPNSEPKLRDAVVLGAIDEASTDVAAGVAAANLVIVCTPVDTVAEQVLHIAKSCQPSTLITDVGSTKASIVRAIEGQLPPHITFVGSHPLAGSEKTGVRHARADLLVNKKVVVTPTDSTPAAAVTSIERFWTSLGALVDRRTPEDHDEIVAVTSHLMHLVASALAGGTSPEQLPLTASGWASMTRIAGGDPAVWLPIFRENRANILKAAAQFATTWEVCRAALEAGDFDRLGQLLAEGRERYQQATHLHNTDEPPADALGS